MFKCFNIKHGTPRVSQTQRTFKQPRGHDNESLIIFILIANFCLNICLFKNILFNFIVMLLVNQTDYLKKDEQVQERGSEGPAFKTC